MGEFVQGITDGIYTGKGCNANCFFCIDKSGSNKSVFESYEAICSRIDYLSNEGAVTGITYEGGDFTIHPDLFAILKYGQSKGLKQTIQTNGIRLADKSFVKELKDHGIKTINFSLHAHEASAHNQMMGTKDSFGQVLQGMKNCTDLGLDIAQNFVITSSNIDQIEKMIVLSLKMKVVLLTYLLYIPIGNSDAFDQTTAPDLCVSGKELSKMLRLLSHIEKKAGRELIHIKFYNIPLCLLDEDILRDREYIVSKFRRSRETKEVVSRDFYYAPQCTGCSKYDECSGLTLFYQKHYGDDFLKVL